MNCRREHRSEYFDILGTEVLSVEKRDIKMDQENERKNLMALLWNKRY